MSTDAEAARRMHDAAVQLGASCDTNCFWNPSMANDNYVVSASFQAALTKAWLLIQSTLN